MRVVVLGGTGNFGARIVRALHREVGIEVVAASRSGSAVVGTAGVSTVRLDAFAPELKARLVELAADLVIHTVGPFQGQDYRVVQAVLAAGAHYLDLADGREFVCGFADANRAQAEAAGRVAISGASTLPALSSAVVESLREDMNLMESVEITIAPGQNAVRGVATMAAVFSYLGRPIRVWQKGRWVTRHGWMDIRRVALSSGTRWGALCEVPDLTLIPAQYPEVQDVSFHAALEFRLQHAVLWTLAALRRLGLPFAIDRWAQALDRLSGVFDPFAGPWGGMRVSVIGKNGRGQRVRRTWTLKVPAADGPEIPTLAAILLAQRLAREDAFVAGAYPCIGLLTLDNFQSLFARCKIRTQVEENVT
jgi:saccharopine dehydrogenase-like NADP-dependent oxidoreductase